MISLFDLFRVGLGPSSSHTVGPMRAARLFVQGLADDGLLDRTAGVRVTLFGSLALTGRAHGTDRGLLLGLEGDTPEDVPVDAIDDRLARIRASRTVSLLARHRIPFDEGAHLVLDPKPLPFHSNGMRFVALDAASQELRATVYYSIGGGFVVTEDGATATDGSAAVPYPFSSAAELLAHCRTEGLTIADLVHANERVWRADAQIRQSILRLWEVMEQSLARGLEAEGVLPGGLNVRRRAARLARALERPQTPADPLDVMDWVNVFAIAVNEENAAGGRVVTAPTNGAAGIIPAVLRYYTSFIRDANEEGIARFFLTAGAIGILYKTNASISGAEVGCQGEVGVAASMAAAGLAGVLGGDVAQVEQAAEIAMEHHLGMTCDPVAGLVQIPCIERNAIGAVKAINAARLALKGDNSHRVSLDQVIRTMRETGRDMHTRYKETALGGLAVNVVEC